MKIGETTHQGLNKIDNEATDGLNGVSNSLAYRVHEIEKHFHSSEFWYGDGGSNTMTRAANHNPWTLAASATPNTYGTEVQVSTADDFLTDMATAVKLDLHEIMVCESTSNDKNYMIQFWCGDGLFGAASFLTEVPYRTGNNAQEAQPITIMCPRFSVGCKIWARVKCETGSASLDIIVGIHGYVG